MHTQKLLSGRLWTLAAWTLTLIFLLAFIYTLVTLLNTLGSGVA